MSDMSQCIPPIAAWFWTYWIHSTVFLALCAALVYLFNPRSYALKAWLWKSAATVPVLTSVAGLVLSNYSMQFGFVIDNTLAVGSQSTYAPRVQSLAPKQVAGSLTLTDRTVDQGAPAIVSRPKLQSNLPTAEVPSQHTNTTSKVTSRNIVSGMASNLRSRLSSTAWPASFLLLCSSIWCLTKVLHFACVYRRFLSSTDELQSGELLDELQRFLKSAGICRRVRLLTSEEATQPFAIGILRWTIVVPRHIEVVLDRKQLRALFAHEVGHLLRRDAVWISIGGLLCSFLAFQPLNFVARRRWRDAAEFLADDWAVRHGVAPLNLVRCLAKVAEWQASEVPTAAMSFANSTANALTRRVEHLLSDRSRDNWKAPARLSANLTLTIVGLLVVFFGPNLGAARATVPVCQDIDRTQLTQQLEVIAAELRCVTTNLNQIETNSGPLGQIDRWSGRVEQLKQRSATLVEHAELLSELCKKDLP